MFKIFTDFHIKTCRSLKRMAILKIASTVFNDTHREKLFNSIQYKNGWLAASELFRMFMQSVKFNYTFHYHVLRVQIFE